MVSARDNKDVPSAPARASEWVAFSASLPLFVVSVGLFVGSAVVYSIARSIGPGGFPLWGLLMTLGFIAAIGTTVSWFFAKGVAEESSRPADAEVEAEDAGRPAPDVRRASTVPTTPTTPDWDESTIPARPVPRPPARPVAVAPLGPDDVERALDEIAQIEEELEGRGRSALARPISPARS